MTHKNAEVTPHSRILHKEHFLNLPGVSLSKVEPAIFHLLVH